MKLLPVIEFEPGLYQTRHHEIPNYQDEDEWDMYWKNSLADSGIIGLESYNKASWLVETDKLINHNEALEKMLRTHMACFEPEPELDFTEQLSALSGGYILEVTTTNIVYPNCCCSLEDFQEWKDASKYVDFTEKMLWIGHPWLMVSAVDEENLQIRRIAEYGEPPEPVIFEIKRSDLKSAIAAAEEKLFKFKQVLLPILRKIINHQTEEVLEVLINGHYSKV